MAWSKLAALASRDWQTPRQQWAEWVAALDSDDFSERQQALLKFHEPPVDRALAWLQRLPQPQLSAEQRLRVSELTRQIAYPEGDVARRTALWLVDDPGAWLALLQREDPAVRATAWEQFAPFAAPPSPSTPPAPPPNGKIRSPNFVSDMANKHRSAIPSSSVTSSTGRLGQT